MRATIGSFAKRTLISLITTVVPFESPVASASSSTNLTGTDLPSEASIALRVNSTV